MLIFSIAPEPLGVRMSRYFLEKWRLWTSFHRELCDQQVGEGLPPGSLAYFDDNAVPTFIAWLSATIVLNAECCA